MIDFLFHPEAEGDLDEIWEYIAGHHIEAADRILDEIEDIEREEASPCVFHFRAASAT